MVSTVAVRPTSPEAAHEDVVGAHDVARGQREREQLAGGEGAVDVLGTEPDRSAAAVAGHTLPGAGPIHAKLRRHDAILTRAARPGEPSRQTRRKQMREDGGHGSDARRGASSRTPSRWPARWAAHTAEQQTAAEKRTSGRLARLVADPAGLDLAVRFVDRVARPEDLEVAARELHALAGVAGSASFLGTADRMLLGVGSRVAPLAPTVVVPLARQRLRQLVGHLVVDAEDAALARHLAAARADGYRLNINLLGEAVLGEQEAASRAERVLALLARDDVDYVSIKVSSLVSQISPWDTAGTSGRVLDRLRPLYQAARATDPPTFLNLDMEEYRDLELTLDVFETLLSEPDLLELEAGIVLQAYLPDTPAALDRLIAFAQQRRELGGGRIKVRLVKGANLAMERVEAELHGWPQAPYPTKGEVDANYVRLLEAALRPERLRGGAHRRRVPQPLRPRVRPPARDPSRRRRGDGRRDAAGDGPVAGASRACRRRPRVTGDPVHADRGARGLRRGGVLPRASAGGERGAGELPARAVRR